MNNSNETPKKGKHLEKYKWKKGDVSPNPSGRPKDIINYIKERTNNVKDQIDILVKMSKGEKIDGVWGNPRYKDVREAAIWIIERVLGKSPITLDSDSAQEYDLHQILLVHLQKKKDQPGVFDVTEEDIQEMDKEEG